MMLAHHLYNFIDKTIKENSDNGASIDRMVSNEEKECVIAKAEILSEFFEVRDKSIKKLDATEILGISSASLLECSANEGGNSSVVIEERIDYSMLEASSVIDESSVLELFSAFSRGLGQEPSFTNWTTSFQG